MGDSSGNPTEQLQSLAQAVRALRGSGQTSVALNRWHGDSAALRFHFDHDPPAPPLLLAIVGGTGTGKSTLLNRLLEKKISGTSFRRTFTDGPLAVVRRADDLPTAWLDVEHLRAAPDELPVRGQSGALVVVRHVSALTDQVILVDTPDLDGDQPAHHAQADRAFRWAQAVLFLVTPEKYQMTELLPYYRLARRYALPTLFVMNKCEEDAVVEDYRKMLGGEGRVFVNPRDDAAYEPPGDANLASLRDAIASLQSADQKTREQALAHRTADLIDRLKDHVLAPLWEDRRQIDRMIDALRAMESPDPGVDVNPLTRQLQRRLQQRSVLYLIGPRRVLDRVLQVPALLARLPRTAWDLLAGRAPALPDPTADVDGQAPPDFGATVADQFRIIQSRIDDVLRSTSAGKRWLNDAGDGYRAARIDPADAGKIVEQELAELQRWLIEKWNATPRDTMLLMKLLRHLPGGQKLTRWTEAAPYLLAVVAATHHAFFGPVDLLVLGGYSLITWLTERISDEVASKSRHANRRIAQRFAELAHQQIERTCEWLNAQAPAERELRKVEGMVERLMG